MINFLLYLFESGICLTILFGVYILFFRKETYFGFNRGYLLFTMLFSLIIPLIHVSISLSGTDNFESPVKEIGKFRTYYSRLIAMTDPEWEDSFSQFRQESFFEGDIEDISRLENSPSLNRNLPAADASESSASKTGGFHWIYLILIIYLAGTAFFFFRFVKLLYWLMKTIHNNPCIHKEKFTIVQLREETPPFSFFGYVFVNQEIFKAKYFNKILTHEQIHIQHKHSLDLLIAHGITIFQWLNPLVWQLQKAIKTNHEYIADRNVISQGHELFDYQSLLLKQLISIHSVELVNNFNLLSIKKRIAMMNKTTSGISAKLKVLLIVPFAIALFLLFADMTLNGPGKSLTNFVALEKANKIAQLDGIWENTSSTDYGRLVYFGNNTFSVLEDNIHYEEYKASATSRELLVELWSGEKVAIKYENSDDRLRIWWSENEISSYNKTEFSNSLDYVLADYKENIDLPEISQYKLIEWTDLCYSIVLKDKNIHVGANSGGIQDFEKLLIEEKSRFRTLDRPRMIAKLYIDRHTSMSDVEKIFTILRKHQLYKLAFMGIQGDDTSPIMMHANGFLTKLPPLNAKIAEAEELKKCGINLFAIDATKPQNSVQMVKPKLKQFIGDSEKYLAQLQYDHKTSFDDYLGYFEMIREVVNGFRDEYAMKRYGVNFNELSGNLRMKVQQVYPININAKYIENQD